ncbi:MAG: hypothetical protein DME10_09710 [Candidatus Rokuibacteriota bacterium]|nr:MAG: hypothetical protein DME10_09710 [Candidatus Rokubacteria bacterium]
MRERELAILWIALAVVFVGSLLGLLQYSRALRTSGIQAAAERARLTAAIDQKQKEILIEMKSNAGVLQEMSWSGTTGDPAVFLSRVAELAEGSRLRVLGVGPLEQQTTPQFSKSWHAVTVQGPFQDLVELAGRVEGDRGTLEAMAIDVPPRSTQAAPAPGQRGAAINPEIQARFRVTALQLTPQARKIIDDAARASGVSLTPPTPQTGLALPVPSPASEYRDPFVFGASADRPRAEQASAGDRLAGHTVEHITDSAVLLRQPDGTPRRLSLADIGAVSSQKQPPAAGKPAEAGGPFGSPPSTPPPPAGGAPAPPAPAPPTPAPPAPGGPRR